MRMHASNAKAVRELGWETTPIDATIEKAVRWLNASDFVKRRL
jgi:nucleoside-diphosphate-sugar epimerase